jgi:hypothetical protein
MYGKGEGGKGREGGREEKGGRDDGQQGPSSRGPMMISQDSKRNNLQPSEYQDINARQPTRTLLQLYKTATRPLARYTPRSPPVPRTLPASRCFVAVSSRVASQPTVSGEMHQASRPAGIPAVVMVFAGTGAAQGCSGWVGREAGRAAGWGMGGRVCF